MNNERLLLEKMKETLPEKRFLHTSSVMEEVQFISKFFDVDEESLTLGAILHDCTKPKSYAEHLDIIKSAGFHATTDDLNSPETLHAITGSIEAKNTFSQPETVCQMIRWHSTGRENMSLCEKILFLADFIEKTRTYEKCINTREEFYKKLNEAANEKERITVLDTTVSDVLSFTLSFLEKKDLFIHPETYKARDFLKNALENS